MPRSAQRLLWDSPCLSNSHRAAGSTSSSSSAPEGSAPGDHSCRAPAAGDPSAGMLSAGSISSPLPFPLRSAATRLCQQRKLLSVHPEEKQKLDFYRPATRSFLLVLPSQLAQPSLSILVSSERVTARGGVSPRRDETEPAQTPCSRIFS